jgi:hypothetical protein
VSIDPYGLGVWIEMEQNDVIIWDLVHGYHQVSYITTYVWDRDETELMELCL